MFFWSESSGTNPREHLQKICNYLRLTFTVKLNIFEYIIFSGYIFFIFIKYFLFAFFSSSFIRILEKCYYQPNLVNILQKTKGKIYNSDYSKIDVCCMFRLLPVSPPTVSDKTQVTELEQSNFLIFYYCKTIFFSSLLIVSNYEVQGLDQFKKMLWTILRHHHHHKNIQGLFTNDIIFFRGGLEPPPLVKKKSLFTLPPLPLLS